MVVAFKTSIREVRESTILAQKLSDHFQLDQVSFDLEDCDKVLRVEGTYVLTPKIIAFVTSFGYNCEVLD